MVTQIQLTQINWNFKNRISSSAYTHYGTAAAALNSQVKMGNSQTHTQRSMIEKSD